MMKAFLVSPFRILRTHYKLLRSLTAREIQVLYRGTVLNILWAVISPLVTIAIYTFVFSFVLHSSFGLKGGSPNNMIFALGLLNGLVIWNYFSTVVQRSPTAISSKPNYVKKIVFPVEIVPLAISGVALFQFAVSWLILIVAIILFGKQSFLPSLTIPFFLLPVLFYATGSSWLLSSIGVFFKDVDNGIGPLLNILWFASAIFFPIAYVPEPYQFIFYLNPVAACVEESRKFAILGQSPNLSIISIHYIVGWLIACFGLYFFRRTKGAFADVL